jgi:hypothetical protein
MNSEKEKIAKVVVGFIPDKVIRHKLRTALLPTPSQLPSIKIIHEFPVSNGLADLFNKHGSDKSSGHTYGGIYDLMFSGMKDDKLNIFECGLGTNNVNVPSNMGADGVPGASLRAWRDFFPNAQVYGGDVDRGCLFQEDRIKTGFIDQLDARAINEFFEENAKGILFDIMVDDGLHTFEANKRLFENAVKYLADKGTYVIEDIGNLPLFIDWANSLKNKYVVDIMDMSTSGREDNIIMVIRKK